MTVSDIYSEILLISEKVVAGTMTVTNADWELKELALKGRNIGIEIDSVAILHQLKKELTTKVFQEVAAETQKEDEYESSYVEDDYQSSYESSFESSY